MILDGFIRLHCHDNEAQKDLAELLDEDVADDFPACDAVASGDFLGGVQAVFIEPGPGLAVEEVEEAGVEPVGYYWQGEGKVFVGDEGEERRPEFRRRRCRVHNLCETKPGGSERMRGVGQLRLVVGRGDSSVSPARRRRRGRWSVEPGGKVDNFRGVILFAWDVSK